MLRFLLFNVGHGFCAYVTMPSGVNMLFDCGYDLENEFYPSRFFRDRNITSITNLILSHFDQDHVCDLPNLQKQVTFHALTRNRSVTSGSVRYVKEAEGGVKMAMEAALSMHDRYTEQLASPIDYGGVKVTYFYNPASSFYDTNNQSLVTFLHYEGCGIVIPGDLEREGWLELLKNESFQRCLGETNFFIASHHGRDKGYCEEVFKFCSPQLILLSDKNKIHDSQEHDYTKHSSGVLWNTGETRRVLTTRCDGHILIEKGLLSGTTITTKVSLPLMTM